MVTAVTIDQIVEDEKSLRVGLIKLDVEGAEASTIEGGLRVICRDRPILIISVYHTPRDFFGIRPHLESLDLDYQFGFRKITDDLIKEIVLIGVPRLQR